MKKQDIIDAFQEDTLDDIIIEQNSKMIASTIFGFMIGAIIGMITIYFLK